ncbi:MAG: FAD:protein FMN transferase [Acidobacteriota bacterium]|nr:FAD:protein FMN transferase [Acidobacteriota bacterium]
MFSPGAAKTLRMEASADAMGSAFTVVLYGDDRNQLQSAADQALQEARRLDEMLSNYQPQSEWSKINREAAAHPVIVSKELFDLLQVCINYSRLSEGAFDITVGPLMKVWGFYNGTGRLPRPAEVHEAMGRIGYANITLNTAAHTVFFKQDGLNLDPGGIGKGYAVDRMVGILKNNGIESGLVSAAGSSVYGLGAPPDDESGWHIRIKDPRNPAGFAGEAILRNESLSTSGSSEKFFFAEGKTWSHLMDPLTGYPSQGTLSVSVVSPRTLDSEAWAKPYFIKGRQWTAAHKPRTDRVFYCEDKADQPCVWLQ